MRWTAQISSIVTICVVITGCCWWAKHDCFPPCDSPQPTTVKVEVPCTLPPALELPAVTRSACPDEINTWACYKPADAGKLAKRLADMRDWIAEVRRRCSPNPTISPTTQPNP